MTPCLVRRVSTPAGNATPSLTDRIIEFAKTLPTAGPQIVDSDIPLLRMLCKMACTHFLSQYADKKGTPSIYVMGPTGAGKSTLINILNGTRYNPDKGGLTNTSDSPPPIALAAAGGRSITQDPVVFKVNGINHLVVDCPGAYDTEGTTTDIGWWAKIRLLMSDIPAGKIILVLNGNGLIGTEDRGKEIRDYGAVIAKSLHWDSLSPPEKIGRLSQVRILFSRATKNRGRALMTPEDIQIKITEIVSGLTDSGSRFFQDVLNLAPKSIHSFKAVDPEGLPELAHWAGRDTPPISFSYQLMNSVAATKLAEITAKIKQLERHANEKLIALASNRTLKLANLENDLKKARLAIEDARTRIAQLETSKRFFNQEKQRLQTQLETAVNTYNAFCAETVDVYTNFARATPGWFSDSVENAVYLECDHIISSYSIETRSTDHTHDGRTPSHSIVSNTHSRAKLNKTVIQVIPTGFYSFLVRAKYSLNKNRHDSYRADNTRLSSAITEIKKQIKRIADEIKTTQSECDTYVKTKLNALKSFAFLSTIDGVGTTSDEELLAIYNTQLSRLYEAARSPILTSDTVNQRRYEEILETIRKIQIIIRT
ncbi:hypothetical protein EBR96_03865 [bacterium]|nr:hypothetical protein [bacterium]